MLHQYVVLISIILKGYEGYSREKKKSQTSLIIMVFNALKPRSKWTMVPHYSYKGVNHVPIAGG